jgi:hypothetical protein
MSCGDERFRHAAGPYLLGALNEVERAAFDRHLAHCRDCRAELAELRPVVAALGVLSEDDLVWAALPAPPDATALAGGRPGPASTGTTGAERPDTGGGAPRPVPETLLPGLLARASKLHRRRNALLSALGGIAAAAVVALTVVLVTGNPATPGTATAALETQVMVMAPVHGGPIHATATVADMPWGTKITLHCQYRTGSSSSIAGGRTGTGGPASGTGEYGSPSGRPVYSLRVVDSAGSVHDVGSWAVANGQDTVFTGGTSVPMGQIKQIDVVASDGSMVLTAAG